MTGSAPIRAIATATSRYVSIAGADDCPAAEGIGARMPDGACGDAKASVREVRAQ